MPLSESPPAHPSRRRPCLLLLAGLSIAASSCTPEWGGSRSERDGVVYVQNPPAAIGAPEILEMQLLWRLPSETPAGELVFGAVQDVQQDDAGNFYLLDTQLKTVHVLSPSGDRLGSLGRPGEGPGEFQWPMGLLISGDRSRIGVLDAVGQKIVYLTTVGEPAGEWRVAGLDEGLRFSPLFAWDVPAGMLLAYQTRERHERLTILGDALALFGPDHKLRTKLAEKSRTQELDRPFVFDEIAAESFSFVGVRRDGTVYLSPRYDEYRIEVFAPDLTLCMVITRDSQAVARTAEQIADVRAAWRAFYDRAPDLELQIAATRRVIMALRPQPDGALWVETSRGWTDRPAGTAVAFDVIDSQGRYTHQVALRGEIDPWNDYLYIFGDRLLLLTAGFEATQGALGVAGRPAESSTAESRIPAAVCYALVPAGD